MKVTHLKEAPRTTPTKTGECPTSGKTRTTDLLCVCGKKLTVTVPKAGWLVSLIATALANRWKVEQSYEVQWSNPIDAYCPNCHGSHTQRHD